MKLIKSMSLGRNISDWLLVIYHCFHLLYFITFSSFWGIYLFWINLKFVVMHEMPPKLSDSRKTIKYLDLKTLELLQNEQ